MDIAAEVRLLPESPGVYRFLDEAGTVIYVGKAKNLRRRVLQYFQATRQHSRKTLAMVARIAAVRHTVVDSEQDALLLENNLIKQFQPRYNILLKDGKTYPWICIRNEMFPRVFLTRRMVRDGSLYFGPYGSVMHARQLLELIDRLFRLRTCKHSFTPEAIRQGRFRVCLDYHLGKCAAPCTGGMSEAEYRAQIESVQQILRGNTSGLIRELDRQMKAAAAELRFEEAHACKQKMEMLEQHYSRSIVANARRIDADVFSLVIEGSEAFGNFMRLRDGAIVQSVSLELRLRIEEEPARVLGTLINGVYAQLKEAGGGQESGPQEILVPFLPDLELPGRELHVPVRGDKAALLELSRKNAAALRHQRLRREEFTNPKEHADRVTDGLMRDLGMSCRPVHIECFDNSNIQGTNPVASCVVFRDAAPAKRDYRHFNIRTVVGANDFASMKEVVNRRYARLLQEGAGLPQLVVIDGGKGQVGVAVEALTELGLYPGIKVIGLAKRLEEIIVPGDPHPLLLDKQTTSLRLLMQIRDEAHRFGITHHRNRRSKSQLQSELEDIPGIGPKSIDVLLKQFRTVSRIRAASREELEQVLDRKKADAVLSYYCEALKRNPK